MASDSLPYSSCYLGLDLGTSSLKAVIVDEHGGVCAEASEAYPTARPHVGWSEQNPGDWCVALELVVERLRHEAPEHFRRLAAVGLCSAAHLPVLLDNDDNVVRPAVLWNDQRSVEEARALDNELGCLVREQTLNEPTCTWTLPQLMWIGRNEPDSLTRARALLSSKDYIIALLTGQRSMDVTSAAATLAFDVVNSRWSPQLMKRSGLPASAFPEVFSSTAVIGLVGGGARTFGLPAGLPVVSGCLDTAAELVACGVTCAEDGAVARVGSSGALLAIGRKSFVPGVLNYPLAIGEGHYWQTGTNAGALSLQWIRDVGNSVNHGAGQVDFVELDRIVSLTETRKDAIIFHPYLQGERAPYWNPQMRASFSGINGKHSWPDLVRAVMEGVAFSLRDCLGEMQARGIRADRFRLVGGITRSPVWTQILADVLERPLEIVDYAESSKGAALIARYAIEGDLPQTSGSRVVYPLGKTAAIYTELFDRYRSLAAFMNESTRPHVRHAPRRHRPSPPC